LPCPPLCPADLYAILQKVNIPSKYNTFVGVDWKLYLIDLWECWDADTSNRPSFKQIILSLQGCVEECLYKIQDQSIWTVQNLVFAAIWSGRRYVQ